MPDEKPRIINPHTQQPFEQIQDPDENFDWHDKISDGEILNHKKTQFKVHSLNGPFMVLIESGWVERTRKRLEDAEQKASS